MKITPKQVKSTVSILVVGSLIALTLYWTLGPNIKNDTHKQIPSDPNAFKNVIHEKFKSDQLSIQQSDYNFLKNEIEAKATYSLFSKNPQENNYRKAELLQELEKTYLKHLIQVSKNRFNQSKFDNYLITLSREINRIKSLPSIRNTPNIQKEASNVLSIIQTHFTYIQFCQQAKLYNHSIEEDFSIISKSKTYLRNLMANFYLNKNFTLKKQLSELPNQLYEFQITQIRNEVNNPPASSEKNEFLQTYYDPMMAKINQLHRFHDNYGISINEVNNFYSNMKKSIEDNYKNYLNKNKKTNDY